MKRPWALRGHMLPFLIEEAFHLLHRVLSLVSGQSAMEFVSRRWSVVLFVRLQQIRNSQSEIRNFLRWSRGPVVSSLVVRSLVVHRLTLHVSRFRW